MRYEFKLPDIGEGLHEAEIIRWLIQEGDEVAADQPIAEIQTDKAMVEITTPVAGKVVALAGPEGATVKVGEALIVVEQETGSAGQQEADSVEPAPLQRKKRVIAAPSVRKRAREMGVPIEEVEGSGEGGRVTLADLERYVKERESAAAAAAPSLETAKPSAGGNDGAVKEERLPIRGLRKKIAEKMVKSAYTAPHVTGMDEVDVTKLVEIRTVLAKQLESESIKLTYLPFVIKAVTRALQEHPIFNAMVDEETNEIVLKKEYHIGIATATKEGLVVPVIKHADQKSIRELAMEIADLSEKAHRHTLRIDELQGSTFTITSTGAGGGWFATPIINYPEVAILGVHAIKRRPAVVGDEIVIRNMMGLSLTFDHRVIDGEPAGRFMRTVARILEHPEQLLLDVR
ncbi:dihydrolipoamide acetyltransferase family protein [Saccharococcus caldoxylosilyticus]|jgi:pyruvate dehydrogenase E2 component (dihydrolipoamide acetyltransferase)|uniref:Dihydrolipoamide acetyltransferase component of pyruvate dehydrogenase complex n=2 Tax=Saccharococcus caldoxylosilyticus TaxID=81408 RepID=A0A023DDG3_9BACL|nr:dihydrolipoamide acetyltransferase family protein [Parageobacillus caldoxylosilyticus]OQP03357.1 dienelactone hydrolase [Geobacillus sp. 44B]KYD11311.1 Dihydrolipoamide acyltransferase component [Parageobacillus caldoxylosilyticus]MBB3852625.1 pyruvate dehydrogenase E2 component (dihydrolipoamide acetyltransferase) [Parageobacillus caldoxylosilyticus]QNU38916.1 2-oxo acid dehydrogenase subunit E2 [Geobacillus sp. 44B]QXJ38699.1 Dihydrolipoyllysine-residue acetyltransferase component of pyru